MSTTYFPVTESKLRGRLTWRPKSALGRALQMVLISAAIFPIAIAASPVAEVKANGVMVDVGGRSLRLVCEGPLGSSKPTVIFESGAFGFAGDWAYAQKQLASQGVRSCAYDRAGMGLSDASTEARDGVNVAKDLEKLLTVANVPAPYVLVGHSMAGARVHLFANRNPDNVAGLVLVDSTTPDAAADQHVMKYIADFTDGARAAAMTAKFGILTLLSVTPLGDKVGLPPQEDAQKRHQFASAGYNQTSYDEVKNWPLAAAQARATGPLNPKWPVAVISAGVLSADEGAQIQALQPPPALAANKGFISVVEGATHNGLLGAKFAPNLVQGINFVLDASQNKSDERASTVRVGLPIAVG